MSSIQGTSRNISRNPWVCPICFYLKSNLAGCIDVQTNSGKYSLEMFGTSEWPHTCRVDFDETYLSPSKKLSVSQKATPQTCLSQIVKPQVHKLSKFTEIYEAKLQHIPTKKDQESTLFLLVGSNSNLPILVLPLVAHGPTMHQVAKVYPEFLIMVVRRELVIEICIGLRQMGTQWSGHWIPPNRCCRGRFCTGSGGCESRWCR